MILLDALWFGVLLLTYPLNLLHEYSHYFAARLFRAEVVNFKITVRDGETAFIPRRRSDAILILLAPVIVACIASGLLLVLNIKFGPLLFVLWAFMLPSPRDVKAIIQALAYKGNEAYKND
jgi:hypothetical protein